MTRRKNRRLEKGIRPWRGGLQGYVRVRGVLYTSKDYPLDEPLEHIRAWRLKTKREHFGGGPRVQRGTFAGDIDTFGKRIAAKATAKQMLAHMELWAAALGRDRSRHSITATDIDVVMQSWLTTPSLPDYAAGERGRPSGPDGLNDQTVLKRRSTLRSFFRVMNGKGGANPVRGSQSIKAAKPELRGTDYGIIGRILAAMPAQHIVKKGTTPIACLAPLRSAVMAYTGIPPKILGAIGRGDLNFKSSPATVRLERREKGGGVEARTLPLTAEGRAAFVAFDAADAYGPFDPSPLNRSFQRAARSIGLTAPLVAYDLRHSFLAAVYLATGDTSTVGRLGMHAAGSPVTARYTAAAHAAVNAAAVAAVNLSAPTVRAKGGRQKLEAGGRRPAAGQSCTGKVVQARKVAARRGLRRVG